MKIFDFKDMFEKKVRVITKDGKIFEGILSGFEDAEDSASGEEEIELDMSGFYLSLEIPEIKSAILVK